MASLPIMKASINNEEEIMKLYDDCRITLREAGIDQWPDNYPGRESLQDNLNNGDVFVVKDNDFCVATITVDANQDEEYKDIDWEFDLAPALVVHRLSVHPSYQGRGIAKYLCRFAENYARAHAYKVIRLDCFEKNEAANVMYNNMGYQKTATQCTFHEFRKFNCYEKIIE